jgi:hypothetical protein
MFWMNTLEPEFAPPNKHIPQMFDIDQAMVDELLGRRRRHPIYQQPVRSTAHVSYDSDSDSDYDFNFENHDLSESDEYDIPETEPVDVEEEKSDDKSPKPKQNTSTSKPKYVDVGVKPPDSTPPSPKTPTTTTPSTPATQTAPVKTPGTGTADEKTGTSLFTGYQNYVRSSNIDGQRDKLAELVNYYKGLPSDKSVKDRDLATGVIIKGAKVTRDALVHKIEARIKHLGPLTPQKPQKQKSPTKSA